MLRVQGSGGNPQIPPALPAMGAFTATGTPFSVAAGRIAFVHGFKGPAVGARHGSSLACVRTIAMSGLCACWTVHLLSHTLLRIGFVRNFWPILGASERS